MQGILGPAVAGNVPYVDYTCLPLLGFYIYALVRSLEGNRGFAILAGWVSLFLGFTKPQYGLGCVAVAASLALRQQPVWLRLCPVLLLLAILAPSHRQPGMLLALAGGWLAIHETESETGCLPWRHYLMGMLLGLLTLGGLAWTQGYLGSLTIYPLAILHSASRVEERHSAVYQLLPRGVQGFLALTLICLWFLQGPLKRPALSLALQGLGLVLFGYSFIGFYWSRLIEIPIQGPGQLATPLGALLISVCFFACIAQFGRGVRRDNHGLVASSAALIVLAASYDLSYIHCRVLAIAAVPMLLRGGLGRVGLLCATSLLCLVTSILPYYLDLSRSLGERKILATEYSKIGGERGGVWLKVSETRPHEALQSYLQSYPAPVREVINLPGLAFLLGDYSPFQREHPGYNEVFGAYPEARSSAQLLLPAGSLPTPYTQNALKIRPLLAEIGPVLILGKAFQP